MIAVGIAVVIACGPNDHDEDDTQFREDVIYCEEAVARLEQCCGGAFNPSVVECRHFYSKDSGCGQTSIQRIDPAFRLDESKCVMDTSCEQIQRAGICQRATAAGAARVSSYNSSDINFASTSSTSGSNSTSSGSTTSGPFCP